MAKLAINRGTTANDGTGDNLRAGANKVNLNFDEIYLAIGDGTTLGANFQVKDDTSTVGTINVKGDVLGILGGTGISSTVSGTNVTLAVDSTVVTESSTDTLINKTISGADNTLSNIGNSSLTNSSVTFSDGSATDAVSLGETVTISGTANEIESAVTANTVTLGLPNNVTISNNLTVLGDLDVQGTQTVIDSATIQITNSFTFEGTTSDNNETVLTVIDPTADRTISLPNATGTIVLKDTTDTLTNKTLTSPKINEDVVMTATATELNIMDGSATTQATVTLAGTDGVVISDGDVMKQALVSDFDTYGTSTTQTLTNKTLDLTTSGNKVRANFANTGSFPNEATYEGMFAYDIGGNNPYVADAGGWTKIITENASVGALSDVNLTGVANDNALVWNSAQARFNVGSIPTAGFSIAMAVAL